MKHLALAYLPAEPVSHDPNLRKRVMLRSGDVPHLTNFSQAIIPSGESVTPHTHADMYEVFYVTAGEGKMVVEDIEFEVKVGDCVLIEPGERHSVTNTAGTDLVLNYFGIVG